MFKRALLVPLLLALFGQASAQEPESVALELALAIDTSSSVSVQEFELQRQGLAEAFRHPDVQAAIRSHGAPGIAVSLIQWSGNRMQGTSVDWTRLSDVPSAERFAAAVEASGRLFTGSTALGGAIRFALDAIERNRFQGQRRVIDVSGDGFSGLSPRRERDRALVRGVTINGLAILNEKPELGGYYAAHVIGGPSAFVLTAADYEDFAEAIRDKLVREIAGLEVAGRSLPWKPNVRPSRRPLSRAPQDEDQL